MAESSQESGGFLHAMPSPSPSNFSNASTSNLPHPRAHPLKAGSAKEDAARRYIESRLLYVSRRYVKKFQPGEEGEGAKLKGYKSMSEAARDMGEVIDVLWLSGTPSLQIPYLLTIAGSILDYLPSFPPSPKATFGLLRKLDHAFSSLLKGEDSDTGDILPGFEAGMRAGMSKTDMIRCKSLVQATRVLIVDIMNRDTGPEPQRDVDNRSTGSGTETCPDIEGAWEEDEALGMATAKVYEQTMTTLGTLLDGDIFQTGTLASS